MTPRVWTVDPDIYASAEAERMQAARRWQDTPAEQAARRAELKAAADWWESVGRVLGGAA